MHSTRGTLIHELLHYYQSQRNSDYCVAVFGQSDVANNLASGKIDRATHDRTLLYYQAINAIAEQEVYSTLVRLEKKFRQDGKLEQSAYGKTILGLAEVTLLIRFYGYSLRTGQRRAEPALQRWSAIENSYEYRRCVSPSRLRRVTIRRKK